MLKNTINWGSVIMGATLVTGIAAAVAFIPALAAGTIGAAAANLSSSAGGGAIGDVIAKSVEWASKHWGATLGIGAVVGAVTGLFASNATNQEDIVIDR